MSARPIVNAVRKARAKMGRASRGLYGGKEVLFGNNVSFSNRKTRRRWNPNVQKKRVYSEILGESYKLNVTTHALRCIKKYGGLDNYLINQPRRKLEDSDVALVLRHRILEKKRMDKAAAKESGVSKEDSDNSSSQSM